MDLQQLTADLKAYAATLGFDPVGVTTAEPFVEAGAAAEARVQAGLMDGLPWFTAERVRFAADPRHHMPDARSLVALGISYNTFREGEAGPLSQWERARVRARPLTPGVREDGMAIGQAPGARPHPDPQAGTPLPGGEGIGSSSVP